MELEYPKRRETGEGCAAGCPMSGDRMQRAWSREQRVFGTEQRLKEGERLVLLEFLAPLEPLPTDRWISEL